MNFVEIVAGYNLARFENGKSTKSDVISADFQWNSETTDSVLGAVDASAYEISKFHIYFNCLTNKETRTLLNIWPSTIPHPQNLNFSNISNKFNEFNVKIQTPASALGAVNAIKSKSASISNAITKFQLNELCWSRYKWQFWKLKIPKIRYHSELIWSIWSETRKHWPRRWVR